LEAQILEKIKTIETQMYPWISPTLDFWLEFCEKKCGLYMYMDAYYNNIIVIPYVLFLIKV